MRLGILDRGHRLPARTFMSLCRLVFRQELDAVGKTALHRPEFFGKPFLGVVSDVMRGPSFWTSGEREYMAAFLSRLNECPYCASVHTETARLESSGEVDMDAMTARRAEVAAVLPLLEKVTRSPDDVRAADIDPVRRAGVPDEAIVDALHVALIFNTANRLANAFGWSWGSHEEVLGGAKALHRFRYKLPGFAFR